MKKLQWAAIFGSALLVTASANAGSTTYSWDFENQASNSNLSSFTATSNGVTATAVAFYATGPSVGTNGINSVPTSDLFAAEVGEYNGAGAGVCENQSGSNCTSPNHQIDNGTNLYTNSNAGATVDFEFMLIQFSAAVDLSSITLGNYGDTKGNSDPFTSTYFTSQSALAETGATSMTTALEATTLGQLTGTGFGSAQAQDCTTGSSTATATQNASCAENATGISENLSGTSVTYLLIGASIQAGEAGTDFFKIQDLNANQGTHQGATPEPATFALFGLALAGIGAYGRKRKSVK